MERGEQKHAWSGFSENGLGQGRGHGETCQGGGGGYVNFTAKENTAKKYLTVVNNMYAEVFRRKSTDVCNFEIH